jgi:hypothetical protein
MRKNTAPCRKYIHVQAPTATMNKTPALKVPLQTELRFCLRGYEQPPTLEVPRGDKAPGGSPPPAPVAATTTSTLGGQTAATMASGRTPLQQRPRPRLHSRGEDKLSKPKSRRPDLRAEAPYRGKGRTAPEHERRPSSARRLGRSSGARGAATALAAGGGTGSRARAS